MKKALPFILIAGAAIAFYAFRKKREQSVEPLQIGPGTSPTKVIPRDKILAAGKKAIQFGKKIISKARAAKTKKSASKIGFDDSSVLV